MTRRSAHLKSHLKNKNTLFLGSVALVCLMVVYIISFSELFGVEYTRADEAMKNMKNAVAKSIPAKLDTVAYDARMLANANYASTTATTTKRIWPVQAPYPLPGALLPERRIIAYYGNFYSTKMGVLGEYPPDIMKQKLAAEMKAWDAADPTTKTIPAIDYIAITAQGSPGKDGKYRFRMPDSEIDKAVALAKEVHGIVILDIQVGLSNVQTEVPLLEKYLKMPEVHLALDPEFAMKGGAKPGSVIGTLDASDVNYVATYLAGLVTANNLPPKVLIVHRFTGPMVTNAKLIKPLPQVQIIMDMDGWGDPAKKKNTYFRTVFSEPVQFTGFKLFYKNDLKPPSTRLLTPSELLKLTPQPLFIQYQ